MDKLVRFTVVLQIVFLAFDLVKSQDVPPFTESCQHGMYPSKARSTGPPPTFTVSLDDDPATRWNGVMKAKGSNVRAMISQVKKLIGAVSPEIIPAVEQYLPSIISKLPSPYDEEIKGIAKATGIKDGDILLFNIFYEIFTLCTSIITQDSSGNLYHARNLDFGLFMGWDTKNHTWLITEYLRPLVVNVDFTRNGTTLYKTVQFAGYVGVLTGIKPGVFTITLNERFNINGGYLGMLKWILGERSGHWTSFLTRDALEKAGSYDEAMKMLTQTEVLAPVYYIVGGSKPGQASVITRDRMSTADVLNIGKSKAFDPWFILETNYDNWKKPPFYDDRRTPATKCLSKSTVKNCGFSGIYDVLSSKPVLNQLTTYTALMQVNNGTLDTYIRECPSPCWPW